MTVIETAEYLISKCPGFDRGIITDTDKRGDEFCEIIMKNEKNERFPITVSITLDGCSISVGQVSNVTGSKKMTPDEAISAIGDIQADKVVFMLAYADEDDIGLGSPYLTRVFALTGGEDDMSEALYDFEARISKPVSKFMRPFTSLKGRFIFFNYSGSLEKTLTR